MPTRTITIDQETFERLKCVQRPSESISETIKRIAHSPKRVDQWLKRVEGCRLSSRTISAVEAQIKHRIQSSRRER